MLRRYRVVIAKPDPKNAEQLGNMSCESAARRALQTKGDAGRGLATNSRLRLERASVFNNE